MCILPLAPFGLALKHIVVSILDSDTVPAVVAECSKGHSNLLDIYILPVATGLIVAGVAVLLLVTDICIHLVHAMLHAIPNNL